MAILLPGVNNMSESTLPDEVINQVRMLRKQCMWQRSQGTSRDNGYPYHKHQPDCDICRSADLLERQARDIRVQEVFATSQRKLVAVQAECIKELEAELKLYKPELGITGRPLEKT